MGELSTQPDASSSPEADPVRVIACEETRSPDATMPAAIDRVTESMFCNRLNVNEGLTDLISVADVLPSAFTNRRRPLSIQK
jgi:hypothetical protein